MKTGRLFDGSRIWSTDWFADPAREMAKVLAWLDAKRAAFAEDYARRPQPEPAPPVAVGLVPVVPLTALAEPSVAALPPPAAPAASSTERAAPSGRAMRSLDRIDWYELIKGHLYEVWSDGAFLGEVEVLSRATAAPRVYGTQLAIPRSEYEG